MKDINLTDYQIQQMTQLANEKTAIENRLAEVTKLILDSHGQSTDTKVVIDIGKKLLKEKDNG